MLALALALALASTLAPTLAINLPERLFSHVSARALALPVDFIFGITLR